MILPIIIILIILSVTVIIILHQHNRSKERRTLLEKGLDPSLINIYAGKSPTRFFLYTGILLLSIALGFITGITLASLFKTPGETKEFIFLSVTIFTGISCLLCYLISRDSK